MYPKDLNDIFESYDKCLTQYSEKFFVDYLRTMIYNPNTQRDDLSIIAVLSTRTMRFKAAKIKIGF